MKHYVLAATAAAGLFAASSASATVTMATYDLNVVDPKGELPAANYGTVTVTESGGKLMIQEVLNSPYEIHDGNSNHNALSFSLLGDPAVTITNLTSGFAVVSAATVTAPPFGTFNNAIDCTVCTAGYPGGFAGPLSFTIAANSGSLSLASLVFNTYDGKQIYFTTDLVNVAGKTGNVGGVPGAVPEPASWALMLGGFGAIGSALRSRRKPAVSFG